MSFSFFKSLHPSTAVDHSVQACFTCSNEEELIVAKVNILEVWRIIREPNGSRLELVTSFDLHSAINSLSRLPVNPDNFTLEELERFKNRLPEPGLDCLVLSFDEAKISLVSFDPNRPRTLRTVALFNFEETCRESDLKATKTGLLPTPSASFGTRAFAMVDPEYRAICTVVYSSFLAVIPLRQLIPHETDEEKNELIRVLAGSDDEDEDQDEDAETSARGVDEDEEKEDVADQLRQSHKRVNLMGGKILKKRALRTRECGSNHVMFGTIHLLPLTSFGIPQHSVTSACFAGGRCFSPTLLFLYSNPIRSWAPRTGIYRHTMNVSAVSLCAENPLMATRVWSAFGLPYDSLGLLACPDRTGCLVLSTNALIFVSCIPREKYTLALNTFATYSCASVRTNPIRGIQGNTPPLIVESNGANGCWISKQTLILPLKRGELLQVCVTNTAVTGKLLGGAIGAAAFSCSTLVRNEFIFFGSRNTDSVLVSFSAKAMEMKEDDDDEDKELDESKLEFNFLLEDTLAVLGPISDLDFTDSLPSNPLSLVPMHHPEDAALMEQAAKESQEFMRLGRTVQAAQVTDRAQALVQANKKKRAKEATLRDVDLITVGKRNRQGKNTVHSFMCGHRLNVRKTLAVLECGYLATCGESLLLVSESKRTRVFHLVSATEMVETKNHPLGNQHAATLFVKQMESSLYTLQICPTEVKLFSPDFFQLVAVVALEKDRICQVCCEDNVLIILFGDGTVRAWDVKDTQLVELAPDALLLANCQGRISHISLFLNRTQELCLGIVSLGNLVEESGILRVFQFSSGSFMLDFQSDVPLPLGLPCLVHTTSPPLHTHEAHRAGILMNCPVVDFLISPIGVVGGCVKIMAICALADGELILYEQKYSEDSKMQRWWKVKHSVVSRGLRGRKSGMRRFSQPVDAKCFRGLLLHPFLHEEEEEERRVFFGGHRPCFISTTHWGSVSIVPLKSSVSCLLPVPLIPVSNKRMDEVSTNSSSLMNNTTSNNNMPGPEEINRARGAIHAFCSFKDQFVFALRAPDPEKTKSQGLKSTALFFCDARASGIHPSSEAPLSSVAHDVEKGLWGATHILSLPGASRGSPLEENLPLHAPTFAMVSFREETMNEGELQEIVQRDEEDLKIYFNGEPDLIVMKQRLDIVRSPKYATPLSTFQFESDERVLCLESMTLDVPVGSDLYLERLSLLKDVKPQHVGCIVVGTGSISARGEEASGVGRILVFVVNHVDPVKREEGEPRHEEDVEEEEEGRPRSRPELKLIANVDVRGPISAVVGLDGKLLVAMGNLPCSVQLLELSGRNEGFRPVGFFDVPTCVVSLSVVKDTYVLLGDMHKQLQLLRWKDKQFTLLSKTFESIQVFAADFIVDGSKLLCCACDEAANIRVWNYEFESQFLQIRGELNLGVRVGKIKAKRVEALPPKSDLTNEQLHVESSLVKWSLFLGTLAGGLGSVLPLEEKVFRRLDLLQQAMVATALIPRNAGLHPLQSALAKVPKRPSFNRRNTIVDGRIVWTFLDLDKVTQRKLALLIGSTVEAVYEMLLEIDLMIMW